MRCTLQKAFKFSPSFYTANLPANCNSNPLSHRAFKHLKQFGSPMEASRMIGANTQARFQRARPGIQIVQGSTASATLGPRDSRPERFDAANQFRSTSAAMGPAINPPNVPTEAKESVPWITVVNAGKDVMKVILTLLEESNCPGVIISGNGLVSRATITTQTSGTIHHKGLFEIVLLRGLCDPVNGSKIEIVLAKEDASVFGGMLTGSLIAAKPVQVAVLAQVPAGGQRSIPGMYYHHQPAETSAS